MTIKHIEETSNRRVVRDNRIEITELGDNKVMKQSVDDAFIDVGYDMMYVMNRLSLRTT